MIDIKDKSLCTGCTACVSACPVQCIVMRRDREEGFDYPVANPDLCIGCGKCESVCPVLNPLKESRPMASFAARCGNDMKDSSSGGVFPKLASEVIANGGKVYGAAFDEEFNVVHKEIADIEGINELGKAFTLHSYTPLKYFLYFSYSSGVMGFAFPRCSTPGAEYSW